MVLCDTPAVLCGALQYCGSILVVTPVVAQAHGDTVLYCTVPYRTVLWYSENSRPSHPPADSPQVCAPVGADHPRAAAGMPPRGGLPLDEPEPKWESASGNRQVGIGKWESVSGNRQVGIGMPRPAT